MKLLCLSLTLLFFLPGFSQRRITGTILDTTGAPLKNAGYYVLRDHDTFLDIQDADSNGNFSVEIEKKDFVPGASYQIGVFHDGCKNLLADVIPGAKEKTIIRTIRDSNYISNTGDLIFNCPGVIDFGTYWPRPIYGIEDIPEEIGRKAKNYLIDRVGKAFYHRLSLYYGYVVDIDRLHVIEKNSKDYQWTPYSYYLHFGFTDTACGIARYAIELVLDKKGNLMERILLPTIAKNPSLNSIISMSKAKEIAGANTGWEDVYADFDYEPDHNCFIWSIRMKKRNNNGIRCTRIVKLSAHDGEVQSIVDTKEQGQPLFFRAVPLM